MFLINVAWSESSHKWWHRLLFFILDTSLGNAYILYKAHWMGRLDKGRDKVRPMSRADFHYEIASWLSSLAFEFGRTRGRFNMYSMRASLQRKKCQVCGRRQNHFYPGCDGAFLCQKRAINLFTLIQNTLRRYGCNTVLED